jgi:AraC-like DNA-binding protein
MGFRNFNALLHHYRLQEICTELADPTRNDIPILTLALTAGHQFITPFNRAFRDQMGVTPTQYRQQIQQPDSS